MLIRNLTKPSVRTTRRGFTLLEILVVAAIIVVLAGVGGYYLLPQVDVAKEKVAKAQVMGDLTTAVQSYKLNTGNYPASLEALTVQSENGDPPLLKHDAIISPFGAMYDYNPAGPNNGGMQPDISCTTPGGKTIGNWSKN
jgi:general secretion pathway protein G